MTCLIAPSLPAASIAWKIRSTDQRSRAYSLSCSSASASTPRAKASLARGLSADLSPPVSPGSTSFNRNFRPLSTRYGLENLRDAFLIRLRFIKVSPVPVVSRGLALPAQRAAGGIGDRPHVQVALRERDLDRCFLEGRDDLRSHLASDEDGSVVLRRPES